MDAARLSAAKASPMMETINMVRKQNNISYTLLKIQVRSSHLRVYPHTH